MSDTSDRTPLHELVAHQAAHSADAVAVVDGETRLTYVELDRRSDQLAATLRSAGAGPSAPVAVCLDRCVNLVVGLLAVWKAGATYVPLGLDHPWQRISAVLAATGAPVVLTDLSRRARFEGEGVLPICLEPHGWSPGPGLDEPVPVTGEHPAYVLHTSGSTMAPKGVVISHAGIANRVGWTVRTHRLGPDDRVLQKTTLTFDAAGWEIFAPLVSGGTVVLAPPGAERDPAAIVDAVARYAVTVLQVVPSVLRALVAEPGWERCKALRLLFSAGEPLHSELVHQFLDAVEPAAGEVEVWNTYGPTECSIDITAQRFDPVQGTGPVAIGRPIDGVRVVLTDPVGRMVAPGQEGELCAGGVGVAQGYLGLPGLTAGQFVPDPDGPPGARLYRTGDLARLRSDGALEYLGRIDHQLKVGGVRIDPGEVETALAQHPGVLEAAVGPYTAASGATMLAGYVRPRDGSDLADLRGFLAERLPQTHLPATFVTLDALPSTSSGKLDRRALPRPNATPQGGIPDSDTSQLILRLWRELLGVDDVGESDDFFGLGGTSLQLTQLANRLREVTGRDITLGALLNAPTVAAQADLIGAGVSSDRTAPASTLAAIRPLPKGNTMALSSGQRRLWLLDRITPTKREWVSGHFLPIADGLSADTVQQALDLLVERHEALRTRFCEESGEPVQLVEPAKPMELRQVVAAADAIGDVVDQEAERGFELDQGQLVRALLVRIPDDTRPGRQTLVLLMHHIVCDGWSAAILEREFAELVAALTSGRRPHLPELPVQYPDFAAWQRQQLTQEVLDAELAHWRSALDGAVPLALRTDRPRPSARDARGAVATFTLPAEVVTALTETSRLNDATLFMTLLTGYMTVLARHTGQWDVVVGGPAAGRERPELEGVVGFFLNNLVLRTRLTGELSFDEALERVRATCREAYAHQRLPFERLVADLAPERDLSRTPLYQVAFDLHDEDLTGTPTAPDDLAALLHASRIAKTDLTLYMRGRPDGSMLGVLEYATTLFDGATVDRLAGHLGRLLAAVAKGDTERLDTMAMATEAELRTVAAHSAAPAESVSESVLDMVERQAAARPEAPAVVTDTESVSYAELDARANKLARYLRNLEVGRDTVVGVALDRGVDLPITLLAVWKAGAAYLPLAPDAPPARTAAACRDAGVRILVTQSAGHQPLADAFDGHLVLVDGHTDRISLSGQDDTPPPRMSDVDLLAYVIYTSGSTGRPKGVLISHRALANHVRWAAERLTVKGSGGAALFSSVAFDLVVPNLWAPLATGQPVRMLPQDLDLAELGGRLAAAGPFSFLKLTPGHLEILTRQLDGKQLAGLAGTVVVAGEALPPKLAADWVRLVGNNVLINEYGPTEASVGTCIFPVGGPVGERAVPIGLPLPGMTLHVLDPSLSPQGIDVPGEIYVGGTGVARGYARQPALTAERFVPDPYGPPGARLYRTGDLGLRHADGAVEFLGRLDDQVKIRGYRVEPGEVAAVLADHMDVRDALVVARGDGSEVRLVGYYVPTSPVPAADLADRLGTHLRKLLPDYLVPDDLIAIDTVPLTENGKLDRAALPWSDGDQKADWVAPRGVVEEQIAEVFTDLLGHPVGAHSHFFRSGGNSILAIRLIAAVQSAFDVDLPIRAVFEEPTVAELARVVEEQVMAEVAQMAPDELAESLRIEDTARFDN